MPANRDRYVRVLVGYAERLLKAGVPLPAVGLLFVLFTFTAKRTIQGCARVGVAGLAEALEMAIAALEKLLATLEHAGAIEFDRKARCLYLVGAVKASGPQTVQSVIAHFRDFNELPECGPKRTIERELLEVLGESDPKLMAEWESQAKACGKTQIKPYGQPNVTPIPTPVPLSENQPPLPPPVAELADAWARLPSPPFAAAAAVDVSRFLKEHGQERFAALLEQLKNSKYLNPEKFGLTKGTPTLRTLLDKPELLGRIINREFTDPGARNACVQCGADHFLIEPCPPTCQDCHRRHAEAYACQFRELRLKREEAEREQAECAARELADAAAAGCSVDDLRTQRAAARHAEMQQMFAQARGRMGARA